MLEIKNMDSLLGDGTFLIELLTNKVPLLCVEEKLSLLERYKLKEVIKSTKVQKRVQHFSEFIWGC